MPDTDSYIVSPLKARDSKGVRFGDEDKVIAVRTAQKGANGWGVNEEGTAYTLDGAQGQAVMETVGALDTGNRRMTNQSASTGYARVEGQAVRRLTPTECERLQGFPDGWTHGKDGPRYAALGDAVTVNVAEWIGRRMLMVDSATRAGVA